MSDVIHQLSHAELHALSELILRGAAGVGTVKDGGRVSPVMVRLWGDGENWWLTFSVDGTRLEARILLGEVTLSNPTPEEREALERSRVVVSLVPAADEEYTDVEVRQDDRIMVMAHVLKDGATSFAGAVLHALGGRW